MVNVGFALAGFVTAIWYTLPLPLLANARLPCPGSRRPQLLFGVMPNTVNVPIAPVVRFSRSMVLLLVSGPT